MKIKPCAFCGGKIDYHNGSFGKVNKKPLFIIHFFDCKKCKLNVSVTNVSSPTGAISKVKAIQKFNRRAKG